MPAPNYAINTYAYTLTHSATDCLTDLADRGFDTFEVMMYPGHAWPSHMGAVERRAFSGFLAARGLTVRSLNQPNIDINLAAATEEGRAYSVDILRGIIELAADIGARDVILGPGKVNPLMPSPTREAIGRFYRSLDVLLPRANTLGVRILAENMPFAFLPGIEQLMAAVEAYGADEIGIIYDIANAYFIGEDLRAGLERCRGRLKMVHLSDTTTKIYRHDPVGAGAIDFAAAAAAVAAIGWAEPPVLELITQSDDPGRMIADSVERLNHAGWDRFLLSRAA